MEVAAPSTTFAEPPAESFTTVRLHIRRPLRDDADALFDMNQNSDVIRFLHWHDCPSRGQYYRNFSHYREKWITGKEYFWVIESRTNGNILGYLSSRRTRDTADMGFVIEQRRWGQGYATEAATELVCQLSRLRGIERIVAYCDARNVASAAVLKKAGLCYRGDAKAFMQCAVDPNKRYDANLFCCEVTH